MRRRDPVKRALWVAALLVSLMLVWSSSLQLKAMMVSRDVSKSENLMKSFTNDFAQVIQNQRKTAEIGISSPLFRNWPPIAFSRPTTLNALQQSIVEDVQFDPLQNRANLHLHRCGQAPHQRHPRHCREAGHRYREDRCQSRRQRFLLQSRRSGLEIQGSSHHQRLLQESDDRQAKLRRLEKPFPSRH